MTVLNKTTLFVAHLQSKLIYCWYYTDILGQCQGLFWAYSIFSQGIVHGLLNFCKFVKYNLHDVLNS